MKIVFVLVCLLLTTLSAFSQKGNKPKVFHVTDIKSSKLDIYIKNNNVIKIQYLVDGKYLGNKNDFNFSKSELMKELERIFPNPNSTGYAYLDIEDPYMDMLLNDNVRSKNFQKAQKLYLDVLSYAKRHRPNVKWGYYGIPFTTYWGRNIEFYSKNNKISSILKAVDVYFPSLYIFYNNLNFTLENSGYLQDNVKEAIKLSNKYNKEVIPFVMSRYHPSNRSKRFEHIESSDFSKYISLILESQETGKIVNGIALWNVDNYFYSINEAAIARDFKKSKAKNFNSFYENYLIKQFELINKEISNFYGK